jgi:hypothetical protein
LREQDKDEKSSMITHEGFTVQHRAMGIAASWATFVLGQAYAVAALLGFLSLKSPHDAIGDPFLSIMALLIVLMAPLMVSSMIAVHAYASPELKAYSLIALAFMILLAGITSSVNFAILAVSRQVEATQFPWLSLFLPYQWPSSVAYALDILAWDWFFALSMLCAAPLFREGKLEKVVRILMIVSGVLCLVGLISVPFADMLTLRVGIIGYGVVAPVVFLLLGMVFGRTKPVPVDTERNRRA